MRLMAGLVAAAALALSPIAHAQVSCGEMEDLLDFAWDDFADISADEIDDGYYDTDYWLDNADECFVGIDVAALYACLWVFDTEAEASSAYDTISATFTACLDDWDRSPSANGDTSNNITPIRSILATGVDDLEDMEWLISFDHHVGDGVDDWHISLGLAYY